MIQVLLNAILSVLVSLIQIVVFPINALINATLPDISTKITELSSGINNLFNGILWPLGVLPTTLKTTLLFIIAVELTRMILFVSTHSITLVLDLIKRLKFW